MEIHIEDHALWFRVMTVAFDVARDLGLPLKSIQPDSTQWREEKPENCQHRLGQCFGTGDITIVLRFRRPDGSWMEAPRPAGRVFETVAHELAHLKHLNHGKAFWRYATSVLQAVESHPLTR